MKINYRKLVLLFVCTVHALPSFGMQGREKKSAVAGHHVRPTSAWSRAAKAGAAAAGGAAALVSLGYLIMHPRVRHSLGQWKDYFSGHAHRLYRRVVERGIWLGEAFISSYDEANMRLLLDGVSEQWPEDRPFVVVAIPRNGWVQLFRAADFDYVRERHGAPARLNFSVYQIIKPAEIAIARGERVTLAQLVQAHIVRDDQARLNILHPPVAECPYCTERFTEANPVILGSVAFGCVIPEGVADHCLCQACLVRMRAGRNECPICHANPDGGERARAYELEYQAGQAHGDEALAQELQHLLDEEAERERLAALGGGLPGDPAAPGVLPVAGADPVFGGPVGH